LATGGPIWAACACRSSKRQAELGRGVAKLAAAVKFVPLLKNSPEKSS
jgi:hypothetical protein